MHKVKGGVNMSSNKSNSGGGTSVGFCALLTLVFITLKLLGKITWSWLWVLSPMWIPIVIIIAIAIIISCRR